LETDVDIAYRVVLVEDHALTRAGLRAALDAAGLNVVGEAEDGPRGLEEARRLAPDVAVIDLGLPGMDGIELTRQLRAAVPKTRIVILTMHDLDTEVLAALSAGADAYCVKSTKTEGIVAAVRVVAEGGAYFDPAVAHIVMRKIIDPNAPAQGRSPLSPRETEILKLVADGVGNAEIADRLALGLGTVKGHVRDILEKLSASDRTQAAVVALRRGII
jgi:two-component system, NarL family, response regulator LiaR